MTTFLGPYIGCKNLTAQDLNVTGVLSLQNAMHLRDSGTHEHVHELSSNKSIVYFKYAMVNKIDKISVTNGSSKATITLAHDHHIPTASGVKMHMNGAPTGNLHGATIADLSGEIDLDTWSNALGSKEFAFDLSGNATSAGDIDTTSMTGTILIYKSLDLAGEGATWVTTFNQSPASLHP